MILTALKTYFILLRMRFRVCWIKSNLLIIVIIVKIGSDSKIAISKKQDFVESPPQVIRHLKSFYKANLDINKPLCLWVLMWTLLNFRTFGSVLLCFLIYYYLYKISLISFIIFYCCIDNNFFVVNLSYNNVKYIVQYILYSTYIEHS